MAHSLSPSILLIDSDPGFVYLIGRYAQRSGYNLVYSDRPHIEAAIHSVQPRVIVVDTPEPLSWELLHTLKTANGTRHIPIVLCSTLVDQEQARRAGANWCLGKPVLYIDFLAALTAVGMPIGAERLVS